MTAKLIVAGGRDFIDTTRGFKTLDKLTANLKDIEVVCGEARGADTVGKLWAESKGYPVKSFPADWDKYGKAAGHVRNSEMANYGTHLIAFWDGSSRGTKNMIESAKKKGLLVRVVRY